MGYSNESIAPLALAAFRYGGNEQAIIIVSVLTKMAWCSDPDIGNSDFFSNFSKFGSVKF